MIDDDTINAWRVNYGLDKFSPADAMRWWNDSANGMAPAGAVAALGLCLAELEAFRADALRYRWLAENALIEFTAPHGRVFHDGKDAASTRHPLDAAIDEARKVAP